MEKRDPRVDAYIEKSAEFARPVLTYLRDLIHKTCPDVSETIKWGMPFFDYHGSMCHLAAFKQHCALGFWKGKLLFAGENKKADAMGHFGRLTGLKDLPPKATLADYIKQAMQLNLAGVKAPKPEKVAKPAPEVPADLLAALKKNKKAASTFEACSPSCKREYIDWLLEAKRDETRAKRLAQAVEWMAEGRQRHWKYASG
jgi:uncharacterized protein YdeI (YjbR/CyaY-like superfamily)